MPNLSFKSWIDSNPTVIWYGDKKKSKGKWYFVTKLFSDLQWEKNHLVIEKTFEIQGWGQRIFKIFEITSTIFGNRMLFQLVPEGFSDLIYNELEQVKSRIQIGKNIGI